MRRAQRRLERHQLQSALGDVIDRLECLLRTGGDHVPEDVAFTVQSLLWQFRQRLDRTLVAAT